MFPNALKLDESVEETAQEVLRTVQGATDNLYQHLRSSPWIVPASSGTLAAGVLLGLSRVFDVMPRLILHMGYSRSEDAVLKYVTAKSGVVDAKITVIDEGYAYKDTARAGETPPWACNQYYDLKAFRWHQREGRGRYGEAVFWNIG